MSLGGSRVSIGGVRSLRVLFLIVDLTSRELRTKHVFWRQLERWNVLSRIDSYCCYVIDFLKFVNNVMTFV